MSCREENKQLNREKIIATARDIITKDGLEKFTMRYLTKKA
jgi:AcrR family transcriptional regulator